MSIDQLLVRPCITYHNEAQDGSTLHGPRKANLADQPPSDNWANKLSVISKFEE
jgi:hypothetical protein